MATVTAVKRRVVKVLQLADELAEVSPAAFTREAIYRRLLGVEVEPRSLEPYVAFDAARYTRNLVYRGAGFELLVLCWEPGQQSQAHDHAGQHCWMLVPSGRLFNRNYCLLDLDEARQTCRLELASAGILDARHPYRIDPAAPVHAVENPARFGQRAVSVHLYSLPFDRCRVFSLATGTFREVGLSYTSVASEAQHARVTRAEAGLLRRVKRGRPGSAG